MVKSISLWHDNTRFGALRSEMAFASFEFQDLGLSFDLVLGFLSLAGAVGLVQLFTSCIR